MKIPALTQLDKEGQFSLDTKDADLLYVKSWMKEVQPHEQTQAKKWNWSTLKRTAKAATPIMGDASFLAFEVNGVKAGLAMVYNDYKPYRASEVKPVIAAKEASNWSVRNISFINNYKKNLIRRNTVEPTVFLQFVQAAPVGYLKQEGLDKKAFDVSLGEAMLLEIIKHSKDRGMEGRILLHADPKTADSKISKEKLEQAINEESALALYGVSLAHLEIYKKSKNDSVISATIESDIALRTKQELATLPDEVLNFKATPAQRKALGDDVVSKLSGVDVLQYTYGSKWGLSAYDEKVKRLSPGFAKENDGRFYEVTKENIDRIENTILDKLLPAPSAKKIAETIQTHLNEEKTIKQKQNKQISL